MTTLKILGMLHGFDIELEYADLAADADVSAIVTGLKDAGLQPRPRYQKNDAASFEPFVGTITKTEVGGQTQKGNPYFIAHVAPVVAEGQPAKEPYAVKYYDKQSTWRVGDKVSVTKNDKGFIEIKEATNEPPF